MLLEAWMTDSVACCDKCGVLPPASVTADDGCKYDDVGGASSIVHQQPSASEQDNIVRTEDPAVVVSVLNSGEEDEGEEGGH